MDAVGVVDCARARLIVGESLGDNAGPGFTSWLALFLFAEADAVVITLDLAGASLSKFGSARDPDTPCID